MKDIESKAGVFLDLCCNTVSYDPKIGCAVNGPWPVPVDRQSSNGGLQQGRV